MGCATPAAQHTNLPSSLPYTLVSWYLPGEVNVQQRDEAAKQNSMPLIKTAAAKLQSRGGEHDHKNQHFKVILLYFESKIVQWHVY